MKRLLLVVLGAALAFGATRLPLTHFAGLRHAAGSCTPCALDTFREVLQVQEALK